MAKHYTKAELLHQIRHAARQRKVSRRIGFHAISVICTYAMWKYEGWGQKRLQEYLRQVYDYYYGEEDLEKWNERLVKSSGFPVTITYMTEKDNPYKKTKAYRHEMEKILMESENEIMEVYRKYVLIHYNVLMDNGWGKIRLCRNKDHIEAILKDYEQGRSSAESMAYEMQERAGVLFEAP